MPKRDPKDEASRPVGFTRRRFLGTTAVGSAGLLVGCGDDEVVPDGGEAFSADAAPRPDATDLDAAPPSFDAAMPDATPEQIAPPEYTPESPSFGLGVASGDVTETRAILWTRYDGVMPLALVVWEMNVDEYERIVYDSVPVPADGGFIHVDVDKLEGGERYRFAFFEMDGELRAGRSLVGHFRAALPADALERVVLGASSCSDNGRDHPVLVQAAARGGMDAFVLGGDQVYADAANTVEEYRAFWAENIGGDGYRALLASTSVCATWDDHEVDNNWDPETIDADKLASATQAFFENMPLRRDETAPDRIWKRLRWGKTLEVFVLDCRGERLPSTRSDADAQYISPEQLDWLQQGLLTSDAVFKVIVNSVAITNFPLLFDPAAADRWEGYPAQREALLSFIDDNAIGGVLWVAGDFHMGSIGWVDTSGLGANQLEVLAGPIAKTPNPLAITLGEPQFVWAAAQNSFTVFDFDPVDSEVTINVYDEDGDSLVTRTFVL